MATAICALANSNVTSDPTSNTCVPVPTAREEYRRPKANSTMRPTTCIGPINDATITADPMESPDVRNRLITCTESAEVMKAVKEPQFGEQLKGLGIEIVGGSRAELDAFRREQRKQINEIVKASGVDAK